MAAIIARRPGVAVAYHEWQMDRALRRAFSDPISQAGWLQSVEVDEDYEEYEHHRQRLVELGALERLEYFFAHVQAPSAEARSIIKLTLSKQCPPYVDFEAPPPRRKTPLRITIWLRPQDLADWQAFLAAHDREPSDEAE